MRRLALALPLAALATLAAVAATHARAGAPLDWAAEESASLELLKDFIRTDTRSAGETKLLEKVKTRLAAIGLEAKLLEKTPGRGNLVARLKGAGKGSPLLLVAHVDTVNFDKAEGWSADPLGAEVKNGELVGRGVLDDKSQAVAAITALELLKKEDAPLARDVVLMLNADEENSGVVGASYVVRERWDDLAPVGAALNEGGRCTMKDGKVYLVGVGTAEKIYNDVVVRVKGQSGHSSVPRPGNAIAKLARVVSKLEAWKPALRVTEAARGTFRGIAANTQDRIHRQAMADLESADEATRLRAAELLAAAEPRWNALLRSTFAFTLLRGGVKENQLPPSAEVNLNIRLLPDESIDEFLVGLRHAIRDEEVEVEVVSASEPSPPSSSEHPLYKAIAAAAKRAYPEATVVPTLGTGATDSRFLRMKGVASYGLGIFPLEETHERSVHANDERLPVASFGKGLRFYYDVVKSYATSPD